MAALAQDRSGTDLSGPWRAHVAEGDLARRFADLSFSDAGWAELDVPGHWRCTPPFARTDGPLLYRRVFDGAPGATNRRWFVTLDGIFYYGDVWLDGDYLGATEGYFFPHTFEATDALGRGGPHVLAVEVACPRQDDRTAKRLITGVFSHWDNLDPDWNPGGLWRPVRVVDTGPVRLTRLRIACAEATDARGRLVVDVALDPGATPQSVRLRAEVRGPDGATLLDTHRDLSLAGRENHLTWTLDVESPPRWWPRRLGDQHRCEVVVVVEVDGEPSDTRVVRTAFREVQLDQWHLSVNGEPLFVMGSNYGPTRMALADATAEEIAGDVALALEANLDLLRVHAHVGRPELYEAADAAGLLLWQDFPLQWGYGRGVRREAVRQARRMVDELAHHPSIAVWCAHNEPLAIDLDLGRDPHPRALARLGVSMFLPSWNKDVLDFSVARTIRRADPTRPVNLHSGILPGIAQPGTDSHLYFGWYHGTMDGLGPALRAVPRLGRFVSEFGAQAVPTSDDFLEPDRWPALAWESLAAHHSLQPHVFERHVPPSAYETFPEWRDATQRYQAALIQLQVEDLRRLKRRPAGGFCHFCFADAHPAVTWSVLDHRRAPKLGYGALRDACRPVLPMLEPREGLVHVVSERRDALTAATVTVTIARRRWSWTGDVAADEVTYVGTVPMRAAHEPEEATVTIEHAALADDSLNRAGVVVNHYGPTILRATRPRRSS